MNCEKILKHLLDNDISFTVPGWYSIPSDVILLALKELEKNGSSNIISLHRKWTYFCWKLKELNGFYRINLSIKDLEDGITLKKYWNDDSDVEFIIELIEQLKRSEQKKKAYKFKRTSGFTTSLKKECLTRDNFSCVICNSKENLQVDHIIELVDGGENKISNLQTLCSQCHKEKTVKSIMIRNQKKIK